MHHFIHVAGRALLCFIVIASVAAPVAADKPAPAPDTMTPEKGLELLSQLAGTWHGMQLGPDIVEIEYQTTAGESMVIEILGPHHPKEMVTVHAIEDNALMATHYCATGNRTTMRLNTDDSNESQLVFDYVNLEGPSIKGDPSVVYVRSIALRPDGDDRLIHTQVHYRGRTELGVNDSELIRIP